MISIKITGKTHTHTHTHTHTTWYIADTASAQKHTKYHVLNALKTSFFPEMNHSIWHNLTKYTIQIGAATN